MKNQVLSIFQMLHLKKLGIDTSKANMCWIINRGTREKEFEYPIPNINKVYRRFLNKANYREPTFTLQDMLALMPKEISTNVEGYTKVESCHLMIDFRSNSIFYKCFAWDRPKRAVEFICSDILIAAFEMLCWLAENGHLKQQS